MVPDTSKKSFITELSQKRLQLRTYPDEVLKKVANSVITFDKPLRGFADNIFAFMLKHKGVGLAASQVGVLFRVITVGIREVEYCLINPEIISVSFDEDKKEEGCLSLPDTTYEVKRNFRIEVRARNINGGKIHFEAEELLARIIQHEIDHLNGVLICDKGKAV